MAEGNNEGKKLVLFESKLEEAAGKVAEKALNETWTGASGFLGDVFGGLVGDRVKQWRTRNLVDTLAKTKDHLESKGVNIDAAKSLPMGELLVIFEGASKTDDFDLSSMWAALLSNGMNPENKITIDPSFPRLLNELSGLDARILVYLKTHDLRNAHRRDKRAEVLRPNGISLSDVEKAKPEIVDQLNRLKETFDSEDSAAYQEIASNYSAETISYSVSNLVRLGLISNGSGGYDGDTLMQATLRRDRIEIDTSGLRSELDWVWARFDMLSEDNRPLPNLWYSLSGEEKMRHPNYSLTGLAERFLSACS